MGAYIHGKLILCGCLLSRFYSTLISLANSLILWVYTPESLALFADYCPDCIACTTNLRGLSSVTTVGSPNVGTFTAKPSGCHVHSTLRVTPPTSPCPTLSADAEPTRKCAESIFSVQCVVVKYMEHLY